MDSGRNKLANFVENVWLHDSKLRMMYAKHVHMIPILYFDLKR